MVDPVYKPVDRVKLDGAHRLLVGDREDYVGKVKVIQWETRYGRTLADEYERIRRCEEKRDDS